MENQSIYNLFVKKTNWVWHAVYWLFAAFLMFFIFSNRNYDLQIRLILVSLLIVVSYFIALTINKYLIPTYLFEGKLFVFIYVLFIVFIFTLWIISISVYIILLYSAFNLPNVVIPKQDDLVILIAGNYLVVIMAAVIHFIKESYRRLIEKDEVEKQKQLTEIKLKEANLKLLQGQIHPHFLFNMLNNLYGLVSDNPQESKETIIKLSELLDYMLYECDKPEVDLNKELDFIKNYISLEKIRHDEDFKVEYSFPANLDLKIAPLVLFPFIENAFKHGFQGSKHDFIKMKLTYLEQQLKFEIENNISELKSDKYLSQEGKGIGLKNIKERLEFLYKGKYILDISSDDVIFKVQLDIDLD